MHIGPMRDHGVPMSQMQTCETCSTVYRSDEFGTCPTCRSRDPHVPSDDALARATDPTTPDDELGKLAFHDDAAVRAAVYANRSTPTWARNRLRREVDPSSTPPEWEPSQPYRGPSSGRLYAPNSMVTTLDFVPGHTIMESKGLIYATTSTVGTKAKTDDGSLINRLEGRLEHATRESLDKLWRRARQEGANAVVAVHIAAADSEGSGLSTFRSSGVVLIGTAVVVVPNSA